MVVVKLGRGRICRWVLRNDEGKSRLLWGHLEGGGDSEHLPICWPGFFFCLFFGPSYIIRFLSTC